MSSFVLGYGGHSRAPYYEHDSRCDIRQVTVVRRAKKRFPRRGGSNKGSRSLLEDRDGDIDMMGGRPSSGRFNPYHSWPPRNSRKKRGKGYRSYKVSSPDHHGLDSIWYKLTIPYGKKLGRAFILKAITSLCKMPFIAVNFQFVRDSAVFFVNDRQSAMAIKDVHRRVTTPDGSKMVIHMDKCSPPPLSLEPEDIEKIKKCMSKRYISVSSHLNLSSFHTDSDLKSAGLYAPLSRVPILTAVMKIIKENIPEVKQLDLSNNRITALEPFSQIVNVCKQLKNVSFHNNQIRSMSELGRLKGLELESLVLDGNPLCDDFKDQSTFINAVREKFPKVVSLDGQELPPPIVFDLGTFDNIPPSRGSFFPADDVKQLVVQFLEQFYSIYDSRERQNLLDAYHDQAVFSLCSPGTRRNVTNYPLENRNLANYSSENRNLLKTTESGHRYRLLRQGRLSVVSALSQLPLTQHDPNSFTVDISHVSPSLMCFSVSGVFKEVENDMRNASLLAFSRTFVVVAHGQGFCITNDSLTVCSPTVDQIKAYKFPPPTPSPSPVRNSDRTSDEKKQMVADFSRQTNMNLEFSAKCLEENNWDYQKAAMMFNELNLVGKIPPEAFQK